MRTLKCPCKARKCDECKGCVKCQCHCHGPPPRLPAEKRPTKVKKPPKVKTPRTSNGDDPTPKRRQLTMDELMQPRRRSSSGEKKAAEDAVDTLEDAADDADDVQPRRSSRSQSVVDQGDEPDTPAVATDETAAADNVDANVVDDGGESTAVEPVPEEPVVVPEPMSLEDQLQALMDRRETEVSELAALERQIFELEGAYLRRNQHAGNIAKGWAPAKTFIAEVMKDQLLELELSGENPPDMTRAEEDAVSQQRIFSFSSTSSPAELLAQQWVEHKSSDELLALRLASAPVSRALRKRELTVDTTESSPSPDEGSSSSAKPRSKSKRKR
ncbi:hypothetical protein SPRG_11686 [Saprolegnia parasitica CBS 223.65]|uniref:Uncharacterized protein n=1 Tax=Saprolegnia parasitica (strain CBS 223.65) TaxID=695850 RepID=A0A067C6Q6_SAPPC|nr:hypothetical protein SPRG_11686 [Saprolegnia parasitica CBS 223.65]KDO22502.1 hypothetical protein SPRG_11686 [Saprolegnia parasitica CBS 223.65]|eukprot:XP_012206750.1 hypothetical protein SPRG_11686 [Saprolegnia parasitica CBS 223.65]